MKLTEWFPGDVMPVRKGVYIRKYSEGDCWCRWVDGIWHVGFFLEKKGGFQLAKTTFHESSVQSLPWRGLAEKP